MRVVFFAEAFLRVVFFAEAFLRAVFFDVAFLRVGFLFVVAFRRVVFAPAAATGLAWEKLPPLTVLHPLYRVKPGASILLEGLAAGLAKPLTVLAEQRFGRGQTLVLNVQNTLAWQMHQDMPLEDQTHETFWQQLLRWLVDGVPDYLVAGTEQETVEAGEAVRIVT